MHLFRICDHHLEEIKHYETASFQEDYLQATNISIEDWSGLITCPPSTIYSPPRHITKKSQYEEFCSTLEVTFLCGDDFNTKHQNWGSRLTTPTGREQYRAIGNLHLEVVSTDKQCHILANQQRKIADVSYFCVVKGM